MDEIEQFGHIDSLESKKYSQRIIALN